MILYDTECEHRRCVAIQNVVDHMVNDDAKELMRCTLTHMLDSAKNPPVIMTEDVTYQIHDCVFVEAATLVINEAIKHLDDQIGNDEQVVRMLINTNEHLPRLLFDHLQSELLSVRRAITGTEDWDESRIPRHYVMDQGHGARN